MLNILLSWIPPLSQRHFALSRWSWQFYILFASLSGVAKDTEDVILCSLRTFRSREMFDVDGGGLKTCLLVGFSTETYDRKHEMPVPILRVVVGKISTERT